MMAVNPANSPGKAFRRQVDVASLESRPLETDEHHMYTQLIREHLDMLANSQNAGPLLNLLRSMLKPGVDDLGRERPVNSTGLIAIVRALSFELGRLDQSCGMPIISALLEFDGWAELTPELTQAYVQFFNVLVSVNPKWWIEVANKLVLGFSNSGDRSPYHTALNQLMNNVPIARGALGSVFADHFPHKTSKGEEICEYVRNLLLVTDYAQDQVSAVWRLVISRLVELDVECVIDDDMESESESESESDSEAESESELDSDNESETEGEYSDTDYEDEGPAAKRRRLDNLEDGEEVTAVELTRDEGPMRRKLDTLLTLVFTHLSSKFTEKRIVSGEATPLFNILLSVFKEVVLPTSRPQAVQFIWFFVVHSHSDLHAAYISLLLETALSTTVPAEQRCRAMQYVSSYVARARGLSREQIVFVVSFLADWVRNYIRERENEVDSAASMARFRVLYSAVQALLYIFVFRHPILRVEEDDDGTVVGQGRWEAGLDKLFQEAINTKFNPLQYCQPDVVAMFARIAQREEVASCYSIIERNRWGRFRSEGQSVRSSTATSGLFDNNRDSKLYDSFFPFQPLRLQDARIFISEMYEGWGEQDTSDSESSESD